MVNEIRRDAEATRHIRVVSSFYERLGKGDVPGVLGLLHPQVEWTEAERFPYYSGTWVGPQAVLDNLLKRIASDWTEFAATPGKRGWWTAGCTSPAIGSRVTSSWFEKSGG